MFMYVPDKHMHLIVENKIENLNVYIHDLHF